MRTRLVLLAALLSLPFASPAFGAALDPDAIVAFAQVAAKRGDYATAEKALRDGMAAHPTRHGFHLMLGSVLVEAGKLDEGFYELQWEVLRAGVSRREGATAAQISAVVARHLGATGEPARFLEALSFASTDPAKARTRLAAIAKKRVALDPDGAATLVFLALDGDLAWLAGDAAGAELSYRSALAKDSRYVPAIVGLSNLAAARGDTTEADAFIARAKAIDAQRAAEVLP